MTHYECAVIDDYGPGSGDAETRWDLWYVPVNGSNVKGGDYLRNTASQYQGSIQSLLS